MSAPIKDNLDWLDYTPEEKARTNALLDFEEMIERLQLAGDGIIYESSHGEWCKCWECRI